MKKNISGRFFIFISVLLLTFACAAMAANAPALTRKQLKKVKLGMQRNEVIALLGKPGQVKARKDGGELWIYERKETHERPPAPDLPRPQPEESRLDVKFKVIFDADGKVVDTKRKILTENQHSYLVPPAKVEPVKLDPAEQGS